jgi:hypothetical protein
VALFSGIFETLPASQWHAVVQFYQPHVELTDEQALSHRWAISREQPDLPSHAGKACAQLWRFSKRLREANIEDDEQRKIIQAQVHPNNHTRYRSRDGRIITVTVVRRPDPDYPKMIKALGDEMLRKHGLAPGEIKSETST